MKLIQSNELDLWFTKSKKNDVYLNKRHRTKPGTSKGAGGVMIPAPFLRVSGSLIVRDSLVKSLGQSFKTRCPHCNAPSNKSSREDKISSWWFQPPIFSKNVGQKLDHFPKLEWKLKIFETRHPIVLL